MNERLNNARAAKRELLAEIGHIDNEIQRVETAGALAQKTLSEGQAMKQTRRSLFAKMFRSGKVSTEPADVTNVDKRIASDAIALDRAADMVDAQREVLAELRRESAELVAKIAPIEREIALAEFDVAREDIQENALEDFHAACEVLKTAYSKLAGGGIAHCNLAEQLRTKFGEHVQPLGTLSPVWAFDITAIGFGITVPYFNLRHIDCSEEIPRQQAEALARWRAA